MPFPTFGDFFEALWGLGPFPWQAMLAERIGDGSWPRALDLPTASGKTGCMDAAVWALARQADRPVSQRTAPRRIWFVVDRRIVVDEAHARATVTAERLSNAPDGPLKVVADRLREVGGTDRPLAVARLRGGILRDDGWGRIPSQPAVITSTVDQLGSRLLFRGYGRSHLTAPIFAGLAANDSLILLDEAHCSVPFLQTLRAVERFRGKDWAEHPIPTPFAFSILSATPPPGIPEREIFPGSRRAEALDHPVLNKRLRAPKPAELVVLKTKKVETADPLIKEASERAKSLVEHDRQRVAVIVNRVRTAAEVASTLREKLGDSASVVLLTGRLRPFERDRLVERWKPFLKADQPKDPERPVVLVSTQCIEVGADFSFDGLVTEAASLDALRQRFGRLNRMGEPGTSPAAILIRDADTGEASDDPIYGASIGACWNLLDEHAETPAGKNAPKAIDFGIDVLDKLLADGEDPSPYLAPTLDAPTLLPAHLDLLCQTSPVPRPEPDIQLFLHGIGRGAAEARVAWRADLDEEDTRAWQETVALCPPSSGETLSVPLYHLRQWLADAGSEGDAGDVEGASDSGDQGAKKIRPVLLWGGRDRSRVIRRAATIRPNDLVLVPACYGMIALGQSEPGEALGCAQLDLWEVACAAAGRLPALRLHPAVLEPWLDCPPLKDLVGLAADPACERDALRTAIEAVLAYQPAAEEVPALPPEWLRGLLREVRDFRSEVHPGQGLILYKRGMALRRDAESELFADDDDLLSATGQDVSLPIHSSSVKRAVEKIASRCLDDSFLDPLATAAYWHDVGKLDERFQIWLRQGDEVAAIAGEPLAKSRGIPSSPARRRSIREASCLPRDFRHEMLSLQLATHYAPLPESGEERDMILHLVASHHGHGRPFAPLSPDPTPPGVIGSHAGVSLDLSASDRAALDPPHAAAGGMSERFWSLTRRYGWWGLAYLEAILRLSDWYGSQSVVREACTVPQRRGYGPAQPSGSLASTANPLALTGIDGANPLGFLAAVGTLAALHTSGYRHTRLYWRRSATWQPVLSGLSRAEPETLARLVADALHGADVSAEAERRREVAQRRYDAARKAVREALDETRKTGLRGRERTKAIEASVKSLESNVDRCRQEQQQALRASVPRPELAIGKHIDSSVEEYRELAGVFLDASSGGDREPLDFLAAFASDACLHENRSKREKRILAPTPFCFMAGSGHQYFLDHVRQLIALVAPERVQAALFDSWGYSDEKLSMRWDPVEDRRYALMDRDPTARDNKSRTVWMANLLAYRALPLFPSVARGTHLATTAWSIAHEETAFSWPLWDHPVDLHTIRSLLLLRELTEREPDKTMLRPRGIVAAFRARRIKVGSGGNFKINFSPARAV